MTSVDSSRSVGVYVKNKKRKQSSNIKDLNSKLNKITKHIYKSFELKAVTINIAYSNVDMTVGVVAPFMYIIIEGLNEQQRIGRQIMVKAMQYKLVVTLPTTALAGSGAISFIQDRVPTGTDPTITEVYETSSPLSFIKYNSKKKFKVLRDHFFEHALASIDSKGHSFEGFIKINKVTQYSGNAGTQADMTNGGNDYIFVCRSTNTSTGSKSYSINGNLRVYYIDA